MGGAAFEFIADPALDTALLEHMLHLSYFDWQPAHVARPGRDEFRDDPAVARWTAGWGRVGDEAVLATSDGRAVGLAWCRLLRPDDAGNSFVSEDIPCLAIAVEPDARGHGVGGELLQRLLEQLRDRGYPALTLAVEADNPARRLYPRYGFVAEAEQNGYVRMRAVLIDS